MSFNTTLLYYNFQKRSLEERNSFFVMPISKGLWSCCCFDDRVKKEKLQFYFPQLISEIMQHYQPQSSVPSAKRICTELVLHTMGKTNQEIISIGVILRGLDSSDAELCEENWQSILGN